MTCFVGHLLRVLCSSLSVSHKVTERVSTNSKSFELFQKCRSGVVDDVCVLWKASVDVKVGEIDRAEISVI